MLQSVRYAGTVGYGTSVLLRLFSGTAWAMNLLPIPGNHEAGKHGPVRLTPAHVLLINYQQLACRPPAPTLYRDLKGDKPSILPVLCDSSCRHSTRTRIPLYLILHI